MFRFMLIAVTGVLLAGCGSMADPTSWFGDKVTKVKPSKLVDIESTDALAVTSLWKQKIGSGTDKQRLKLVPLVDNGRVYAADSQGLVQAFDAVSGDRLWSMDTGLALSGGPGGGEGLVVVGTSDGEVLALHADSGEQMWKARVSSEVLSVPAVGLGVVVVHTIDGKLFGLTATEGTQRWLYSRDVPVLTLRGSSSPVISGNSVYTGFAGGKLVALDLTSGVLQWDVSITAPSGRSELERMVDIDGDPLISNGAIYVSTYQGELAAVSEYSGAILWRRKLSSYGGIAADWRFLYVSDESGMLWAINPDNGAAMWKQEQLLHRNLSTPAVVDGYVVVGDYDGYLHWLSHADGSMVARSRVAGTAISAAPLVKNGKVYVFSDGGDLAVFKPER